MRVFPIIRRAAAAAFAGTNFVVQPVASVAASVVARAVAARSTAGVAASGSPARLLARCAAGLVSDERAAGAVASRPAAGLTARGVSVGSLPARPRSSSALAVVRLRYDLTRRIGAATVTQSAEGGRQDWANPQNAQGRSDAVRATLTGNALGARGGRLTMGFVAPVDKADLTISSARVHAYWAMSGVALGGTTTTLEVSFDGGASWLAKQVTTTTAFTNAPLTIDVTADVAGLWSRVSGFRARLRATTSLGSTATITCDAIELEVVASRTDNI